jgi:hypothetical protein
LGLHNNVGETGGVKENAGLFVGESGVRLAFQCLGCEAHIIASRLCVGDNIGGRKGTVSQRKIIGANHKCRKNEAGAKMRKDEIKHEKIGKSDGEGSVRRKRTQRARTTAAYLE